MMIVAMVMVVMVMVMVMLMTAMEKIIHANKVLSLLLLLFCNLRLFSNYHLSAAFSFINYLFPAAFENSQTQIKLCQILEETVGSPLP